MNSNAILRDLLIQLASEAPDRGRVAGLTYALHGWVVRGCALPDVDSLQAHGAFEVGSAPGEVIA